MTKPEQRTTNMEEEETFQRGVSEIHTEKQVSKHGKEKKISVKKKKGAQDSKHSSIEATGVKLPTYVETIRFKTLEVGTKLLGVVMEVNEREITLSLPNGLKGHVNFTESSDVFSTKIKNHLEGEMDDSENENEREVDTPQKNRFPLGMLVPCTVIGLGSRETKSSKSVKRIELSLQLSRLHRGLGKDYFQEGAVAWSYVKSVEDHGYLLSFGISEVTGFLLFKDHKGEDGKAGMPLAVGQMVQCLLGPMDKQRHTISCRIDPKASNMALTTDSQGLTLESLLPGQLVTGKVQSVLTDGLLLSFLTYFTGTVNMFHFENSFPPKDWQSKYAANTRLRARIIMVDPATKSVALTLNQSIVEGKQPQINSSIGEVSEEAIVVRVDRSVGLLLDLTFGERHCPAFVHISNISEERVEKLEKKYKVGSKVRARVIGRRLLDGLATATMRASVVEQPFLGVSDVKAGMLLKGKVLSLKSYGAIIHLTDGVRALCPLAHLAEAKISRPPSKFKVGATFQFRVLSVDLEKKRILVSHKRTLITTKLPIITNLEEAGVGVVSHGWITGVKDYGVFVNFYGSVRGLARRSALGLDKDMPPEKVFSEGQVVKCKVIKEADDSGKLCLSFVISGELEEVEPPITIGQIVKGKVSSVVERGFVMEVESENSKHRGFLALEHLSDSLAHIETMAAAVKIGSQFEELLVIDLDKYGKATLSNKFSFVSAAGLIPKNFSELKPEQLFPGYIASISSHGCFVRFLGRLTGLAPLSMLSDNYIKDINELFRVGQSVRAQVIEVNEEANRFTVSLKQSVCFTQEATLLSGYFHEEEMIAKAQVEVEGTDLSWTGTFKIGGKVRGEIQDVKEYGVIVNLEENSEVVGFATHYQAMGVGTVGEKVEGRVLDVGVSDGIVDISLRKELLQWGKKSDKISGKKRKKGDSHSSEEELLPGREVQAVVELVKAEYLVLSFPNHEGQLGFAATKDFNVRNTDSNQLFHAGQSLKATVSGVWKPLGNSMSPDRLLCMIDIGRSTGPSQVPSKGKVPTQLHVGQVVEGKIVSVQPLFMDVSVGRGKGRIHVADLGLNPKSGEYPLASYAVGQIIQAQVLGSMNPSGQLKALDGKQNLLRLTLRLPAAIEEGIPAPPESLDVIQIGQEVMAYVKEVKGDWAYLHISSFVKARLHILESSLDLSELQNFSQLFLPGKAVLGQVLAKEEQHSSVRISVVPRLLLPSLEEGSVLEGQELAGRVGKVLPNARGLSLQLGPGLFGHVGLTELSDDWWDNPLEGFQEGQFVRCRVLSVSSSKQIDLSLRASLGGCNGLQSRLKQLTNPLIRHEGPHIGKVEELKPGSLCWGYVKSCTVKGCFVSLSHKIEAFVRLSNLSDTFIENPETKFPPGKLVRGRVLSVDTESKRVEVSLNLRIKLGGDKDKEGWLSMETVKEGMVISGKVKRTQNYGIFILLDNSDLTGFCHISEVSDEFTTDVRLAVNPGDSVKALIIKVDKEKKKLWLSLKKSLVSQEVETEKGEEAESVDLDDNDVSFSKEQFSGMEVDQVSDADEDEEFEGLMKEDSAVPVKSSLRSVVPLSVELDSEDEDQKVENMEAKDPSGEKEHEEVVLGKQQSKRAKKREKESKEAAIQAAEEARLLGEQPPQAEEDFERLLLANPNSSFLWIKFMAFLLSQTEIAKARAVAERGLTTINYREEQEKLNVWVAYLNLENMCADNPKEAVWNLFQRALQFCDQKKLHFALLGIYERTEQQDMVDDLLRTMTRKFKSSAKVWLRQVQVYLKRSQDDLAHKTLERSLLSLPKHKHIKVTSKTALLDYKLGFPERGRMMYESIVRNFPKRTDLWSQYIDQEINLHDKQRVRSLFERVISLDLPVKKMKFLFKKYLDFEKVHGDSNRVEHVKARAMTFIEEKVG